MTTATRGLTLKRGSPSSSQGGFLAAHDVDNPEFGAGTRVAFIQHILGDPHFKLHARVDNLAIAQRL
jgi:hypothetical protein